MDECRCECHTNEYVSHITPCCDGPCPGCRYLIGLGRMEHHQQMCSIYQIKKEEDERVWRAINQPCETAQPAVEPEKH